MVWSARTGALAYGIAIAAGSAIACTGTIEGDRASPAAVGEDGTRSDGVCAGVAGPATRLVRLTHRQYDNTVRSLLFVDATPASTFPEDAKFEGFDNNADALVVGDRLARDYTRAAATLAHAATEGTAFGKLVACAPSAECAKTSITSLLRRAFRRAPLAEEIDAYVALFAKGKDAIASGDEFRDGLELVVEAVLQSPSFLYRVELSQGLSAEGVIALSGDEVAARLSYMLWNDMPDEALFAAADRGELSTAEQVAAQAKRMLDDPRARGPVADFHRQWLHVDLVNEDKLRRDPAKFPALPATLAASLQGETTRFVEDVFEHGGGLGDLLTAPFAYVNADTASLYGVDGSFGKDLVRVELDPKRRAGLLTQAAFLASHSYYDLTSPIHRGVFVQRQILCTQLPDPPGDVDLKLPPVGGEIKTTRQQVTRHTSPSACQGCHGIINPTGFAFEPYDAIGRWRDTENGEPIDATGSTVAGGQKLSFQGPLDFVQQVSKHPATSDCYATNWIRYAYGRKEQKVDACSVRALSEKLRSNGYSIKSLLGDLTTTAAFRHRVKEAP